MSIDLSKLWPATQSFQEFLSETSHEYGKLAESFKAVDLGRKALDVMMRRGWGSVRINGEWHVCINHQEKCWQVALDPFTALVEADAWLTEREEANA